MLEQKGLQVLGTINEMRTKPTTPELAFGSAKNFETLHYHLMKLKDKTNFIHQMFTSSNKFSRLNL